MGVISGALLFIKNDIPLTSFTEGLVVSSILMARFLVPDLVDPFQIGLDAVNLYL